MSSPLVVNFPTSLDDLTSLGRVNNRAFTTLNGAIDTDDLSATLTDSSVFPSDGALTLVDDLTSPTKVEEITFTANVANVLTIGARGAFGSTAQNWSSGAYVRQRYLAEHHEAVRDALIAAETKIGLGAATPTNGKFLVGNTTAGTSQWRVLANSDLPVPGSNQQVIFNSSNAYAASANLAFDDATLATLKLGTSATKGGAMAIASADGNGVLTIDWPVASGNVRWLLPDTEGTQNQILAIQSVSSPDVQLFWADFPVDGTSGTFARFTSSSSVGDATGVDFNSASALVRIQPPDNDTTGIGVQAFSDAPNVPMAYFRSQDAGGGFWIYEAGAIFGDSDPTLNASARFQVDSTTRGFLPPRMTATERDAIVSPAEGLIIHNTTTNAPNYYDGATWSAFGGAVASVFGRTGAVVAVTNDYTWAQINKATSSLADIATRSASDLSSGTLNDARLSSNIVTLTGSQSLTNKKLGSLTSNGFVKTTGGDGTLSVDTTTYLSGTVGIGSGGTGQTTAANAINALLPTQTGNNGKFLTTDGSVASWATVSSPSAANPTASVGLSAVNGSASTFMRSDGAPALDVTIAPTWSGAHTHTNTIALTSTTAANNKITQGAALNLGTTSTDGIILQNTTAAAAGAQQYSPRLRFKGSGWKTNATAAAQDVEWWIEAKPIQGTSVPTSDLAFNVQTNGSGGEPIFVINDTGTADGATFYFGRAWGSGIHDIYSSMSFSVGGMAFLFNATAVFGTDQSSRLDVFKPLKIGPSSTDAVSLRNATSGGSTLWITTTSTSSIGGNFVLGGTGTGVGTSGTATLAIENGTAPSTSPIDRFQLYSADWNGAGTAAAHCRNEEGHIIKLVSQAVAALTNNVTSGGSNDTIADYSDLTIYANDSAAIRNNIYQLARKLGQVVDAMRTNGLLR